MSSPRGIQAPRRAILIAAIVISALNLRTAVTSVGTLIRELEQGLGLTPALAGVLAALPVITFSLVGALAPSLGRRFGVQRVLMGALAVMTIGLIARALVSNVPTFLACSVLALAGGAIGNVTMPTLVKHYFPDQIGRMSAAYTTSMAVGQTLAAGLSVPASQLVDPADWRIGVGIWAVLAGISIIPWLFIPRPTPESAKPPPSDGAPAGFLHLARSRKAWLIACYFGIQSTQVFVVFGWFTDFFQDAGLSGNKASALVAFFSLLFIPISLIVPLLTARAKNQGMLLIMPAIMCLLGYIGMMTAGRHGAWLWMLLISLGNSAFPMMLTLFGLRTRSASTTAALSAFAQSVGYLIAGTGPIVVGALHGASNAWTLPLLFMIVITLGQMALALAIGRPGYVDDDLDIKVTTR